MYEQFFYVLSAEYAAQRDFALIKAPLFPHTVVGVFFVYFFTCEAFLYVGEKCYALYDLIKIVIICRCSMSITELGVSVMGLGFSCYLSVFIWMKMSFEEFNVLYFLFNDFEICRVLLIVNN